MLTVEEIKSWLAGTYDECALIDLLEINSYELVEAFTEKIEENMEFLEREMELLKEETFED